MKTSRILVFGASGFIGGNFARAMVQAGHEVLGIGRSSNPNGLKSYRQFIYDSQGLAAIVSEFRPDLCLNAAGSARPGASREEPADDFAANVSLVQASLEALRRSAPDCKYIGLSSAAVYGNAPHPPWKESVRGHPESPYGYHKLCAELLAEEYARLYGLKTLTLRAFSVYGPGLRRQLLWDVFCRSRTCSELKLFGTGRETRDFIYIDDLVSGIARLAGRAAFQGEVLNLASGRPAFVSDLCAGLLQNLGWSGHHYFTGEQMPGAPLRMEADISRIRDLGLKCEVDLAEGLRRTAAWLKNTNSDVKA